VFLFNNWILVILDYHLLDILYIYIYKVDVKHCRSNSDSISLTPDIYHRFDFQFVIIKLAKKQTNTGKVIYLCPGLYFCQFNQKHIIQHTSRVYKVYCNHGNVSCDRGRWHFVYRFVS